MATFIEEAKELLDEAKFNRLELLRVKSNNFETTAQEETEFAEIKTEVRKLINQRDKDKNLEFLKNAEIQLVDILRVKGSSKEEITKAVKELFPTVEALTEVVAVVPYKKTIKKIGRPDEVVEAEAQIRFGTGGERLDRQANAEIQKIGAKGFVKHLTEFGKGWIRENHVANGGPKSGSTVYSNIPSVALRFKFKPEALKKELGIQ